MKSILILPFSNTLTRSRDCTECKELWHIGSSVQHRNDLGLLPLPCPRTVIPYTFIVTVAVDLISTVPMLDGHGDGQMAASVAREAI